MSQQSLFSTPEGEPEQETSSATENEKVNTEEIFDEVLERANEPAPASEEGQKEEQKDEQAVEGEGEEEVSAKRFKDLQSMIGRQSNEIGDLRKMNAELQELNYKLRKDFESITEKAKQKDEKPWEIFAKYSDDELVSMLKKEGIDISEESVLQNARGTRQLLSWVKGMIDEAIKPLNEFYNTQKITNEDMTREAEFWKGKDRARFPGMVKALKIMYPEASSFFDVRRFGSDPFAIASAAYELAKTMPNAKDKVETAQRQHVTEKQALNGGVKTSTPKTSAPKQKLSLIQRANAEAFPELYEK